MTLEHYEHQLKKNNIILNSAQVDILTAFSELDNSIASMHKGILSSILAEPAALKGIYLYGTVGTGKSMLMDLFFDKLELDKKQKVHFHAFMLEIYAYLHELKTSNNKNIDPLVHVAKYIAKQFKVLCIDELQIDDITDAMIVGKLFRELLKQKVIIIITSNFAPSELYQDGLQRESFLPFIELMQNNMQILKMNHYYQNLF